MKLVFLVCNVFFHHHPFSTVRKNKRVQSQKLHAKEEALTSHGSRNTDVIPRIPTSLFRSLRERDEAGLYDGCRSTWINIVRLKLKSRLQSLKANNYNLLPEAYNFGSTFDKYRMMSLWVNKENLAEKFDLWNFARVPRAGVEHITFWSVFFFGHKPKCFRKDRKKIKFRVPMHFQKLFSILFQYLFSTKLKKFHTMSYLHFLKFLKMKHKAAHCTTLRKYYELLFL